MNVHGRPKIHVVHNGQRFRAVGSLLYPRASSETFLEFLIMHLKTVLGKDWFMSEKKKSPAERHQIFRWLTHYGKWMAKNAKDENRFEAGWSAHPDGDVVCLVSLSYDIYHLYHAQNVPKESIARLKKRRSFQGALYEIAIAALLVRVGFTNDYLPDNDSIKHGEFIAKHDESGTKIMIEVKSRHREGVYHEAGTPDWNKAMRGDVQNLFENALEKAEANDSFPFMIFIDVNTPPTPKLTPLEKPWFEDIKRIVGRSVSVEKGHPAKFNACFITNFSSPYWGDREAQSAESIFAIPQFTRHSLPTPLLQAIIKGLDTYGQIPEEPY